LAVTVTPLLVNERELLFEPWPAAPAAPPPLVKVKLIVSAWAAGGPAARTEERTVALAATLHAYRFMLSAPILAR
jgi:hypothetical protein